MTHRLSAEEDSRLFSRALWERLEELDPHRLKRFKLWVALLNVGFALVLATLVTALSSLSRTLFHSLVVAGMLIGLGIVTVYLVDRRPTSRNRFHEP
jgi:hypothetical protein